MKRPAANRAPSKRISPTGRSGIDTFWENLKLALFPLRCLSCGGRFQPEWPKITGRNRRRAHRSVTVGFADKPFDRENFPAMSPSMLFAEAMGEHLCPACKKRFRPTEAPYCVGCGIMFAGREGRNHVCGNCLDSRHDYGMARSVGEYDSVLMAIIHRFKYRRRVNLARPISLLLLHAYCRFWQEHPMDMAVPVPLSRQRLRERGFNQAWMVLRPWKDGPWQPVLPKPLTVHAQLLARVRKTPPQTGLGRRKRQSNVRHAFRLKHVDRVKHKRILLVDDVYTTGATVNECARIIMQAGAERVDVLTIARAI